MLWGVFLLLVSVTLLQKHLRDFLLAMVEVVVQSVYSERLDRVILVTVSQLDAGVNILAQIRRGIGR